ncbi:hypothetical protein [Nocardia niwae]|uniref:HTH-type transcriptional repressor KstR2 C-terminal domain-containing protein n=1 Tax=Nocardia niwae TaxID=626084 RepID=A0ABV2XCA5_9NOCA
MDEGVFLDVEPQLVSRALLSMGIAIARWYQAECGRDPAAVADRYADMALRIVGDADRNDRIDAARGPDLGTVG